MANMRHRVPERKEQSGVRTEGLLELGGILCVAHDCQGMTVAYISEINI
jgi:hypothetical protein